MKLVLVIAKYRYSPQSLIWMMVSEKNWEKKCKSIYSLSSLILQIKRKCHSPVHSPVALPFC